MDLVVFVYGGFELVLGVVFGLEVLFSVLL